MALKCKTKKNNIYNEFWLNGTSVIVQKCFAKQVKAKFGYALALLWTTIKNNH